MSDVVSDEAEVATAVADHDFAPPEEKPWGLCTQCGYGQAAHTRVPNPYRSTAPRAPKGAVRTGDDS